MNDSELFNYAIKHYYNPSCKTAEEFAEDYNLTLRIKKLLNRHLTGDEINFRLLLNNFTMFYNVFSPHAATVILFTKLPEQHYPYIKTIATFLNYMPECIEEINIDLSTIPFDEKTINFLREI